ncbi:hypothetical protein KUTeg_024749 [Tegillarca granosa]|uniref:Microtubule-associated protein Jupiter n=1 Tax=Tegillarca granosa TaxID=220873 RepID=A0ABQ9DYA7_TEGGR|nr:hypothetical protein KUTeg_024749 [Tegillarca granosa]
MTTTSTQVGITGDEKPTSRVLRPPGGGSSNIFGVQEDEPRQAQRQKPISNVFGGQADDQPPQRSKPQQQATHSNIFGEQQEGSSAPQQRQKSQGEYLPACEKYIGEYVTCLIIKTLIRLIIKKALKCSMSFVYCCSSNAYYQAFVEEWIKKLFLGGTLKVLCNEHLNQVILPLPISVSAGLAGTMWEVPK